MTETTRETLADLQRRLLRKAGEDSPRFEFYTSLLGEVLKLTGCSTAGLLLTDHERLTLWEVDETSKSRLRTQSLGESEPPSPDKNRWSFDDLCLAVMFGEETPKRGRRTERGSFLDSAWPLVGRPHGRFASEHVAAIPLTTTEGTTLGVLTLRSLEPLPGAAWDAEVLERLADGLATAVTHRVLQEALRERVKELTCLYGISKVAERFDIPESAALQHIADLLPSGWQYQEIASAVIVLDGEVAALSGEREGHARQTADLVVSRARRGAVEIVYSEERPTVDEGPFLTEERRLLDEVARQVSLMLERRQAARERSRIESQLREIERLATIGRMAAGTAHELNEPLGAILGFAQLARKQAGVSESLGRDLDSIIKASLHAREVIRKLLLFSRQSTPEKRPVAMNPIVRDALLLIRPRLDDRSIRVEQSLSPSLPKVHADASQIQQVVINLLVNALQAMPTGGLLRIVTRTSKSRVLLSISDTGVGMSREVADQAFMPFFTTKEVGQGTGLGLSVVHGIVTSHGGSVSVDSHPGKGTLVEVDLPAYKATRPKRTPRSKAINAR